MFIKRSSDGHICSVSVTPEEGYLGVTDEDKVELQVFCLQASESKWGLAQTDLNFVRVLEDVVELLVQKNVITFTELPLAAQEKILARQNLRHEHSKYLDLLESDSDLEGLI